VFDRGRDSFIGLIDILDIVSFFSTFVQGLAKIDEDRINWKDFEGRLARLDPPQRSKLEDTKVVDLIGLSERTAWKPVSVNTEPSIIFNLLADPDTHHIPITDEQGLQFLGLLCQSDVLRWLWQNRHRGLPEEFLRLKAGQVMKKEVVTVPVEATMIEAFMKMHENNISAIPAIDHQGIIQATVSATDCQRLLSPRQEQPSIWELLKKLFLPISEIIPKTEIGSVGCQVSSSLEEILALLANNRVHRVWVVDSTSRPAGVISLSDVLEHLSIPRESYLI